MTRLLDRRLISGLLIAAIVASVLVVASRADGREVSRATPNDGGAWIIDRGNARIAHIDHGTGEFTVEARVDDAGGSLATSSILQADGALLVHNEVSNSARRVTPASASIDIPVEVAAGIEVSARPGGVALFDTENSILWWPDIEEFAGDASGFPTLFDAEQLFGEARPGQLVVRAGLDIPDGQRDGPEPIATVVLHASENASASVAFVSLTGEPVIHNLPEGFDPQFSTGAEDAVVLVDDDQWLVATAAGTSELGQIGAVAALQRPGEDPDNVGALLADGGYLVQSLTGAESPPATGQGIVPLLDHRQQQPILHQGCLHFLGENDGAVDLWGWCPGEGQIRAFDLDRDLDAIPPNSHIRLVNGEIWVDELDGFALRSRDDLTLERTVELQDPDEAEDAEETEGGVEIREFDPNDPNAELDDADQFDEESINEEPEASDDEAGTRVGRDVFVDVLANDIDPNGDVLSVDSIDVSGELQGQLDVLLAPAGSGIVVNQPTQASPGAAQIEYTVTDGRGGSSTATVSFTVHGDDTNLAPTPVPDRLRVSAGAEVRADLLANDSDPEADPLTMTDIQSESVRVISQHPSGVVVLDAPTEQDTFDVTYTVVDDGGAEAEGILSIEVVNADQNAVPDARHDRAQVSVNDRVRLDLLANDVDPGSLELSALPSLVQISGPELGDGVEANLNEDGQFSFEPAVAGTYVFSYEVSNREQTDDALIRIDVDPVAPNRRPVAVRDDVVLGIGDTALARIFDNDGDPDGDIVDISFVSADDIVDWEPVPGEGIRLSLTGTPAQPAEIEYRISDGELESDTATIFISSSGTFVENAPPVTVDDSIRARAGRSNRVFPLRNDFDPEGGLLVIDSAQSLTEGIEVEVADNRQWLEVNVPTEDELGGRRSFELTYTVRDDAGGQAAGLLGGTLIFDDENSAPVARPDRVVTRTGQSLPIPVTENDTDRESDPFDVVFVQPAQNGSVDDFDPVERTILYTPSPGFTGSDEFSYTVRDSLGGESTTFVTVGVLSALQFPIPPNAEDDNDVDAGANTQFTFEAGSGIQRLNVLDNDSDPLSLDFSIEGLPGLEAFLEDTGATVEILPAGDALAFTPPDGLREPIEITFQYTIRNDAELEDTAEVTIVVLDNLEPIVPCVNDIPVPGEFSPGDAVPISLTGSYTDCGAGGELSTLEVLAIGDPNVTQTGDDLQLTIPLDWAPLNYTFDFVIQDSDEFADNGDPLTAAGTVTVQVVPNLPPGISQFPIPVSEPSEPGQERIIDLLPFVSDPEGDPLTFEASNSGNTSARLVGDSSAGQVVYTPNADFAGQGFFEFTVSDGRDEARGRVEFEVIPPNSPPVGQAVFVEFVAGETRILDLATAFTDTDLPDDTLTYDFTQLNGEGVLGSAQDGNVVTFTAPSTTPADMFQGLATATDAEGETGTADITIRVMPSDAPSPIVVNLDRRIVSGETVSVDVISQSTSQLPDDPSLTLLSAVVVDGEVAAMPLDGAVELTVSNPSFSGTAVVQYTIHDGRGPDVELARATGTITVTVIGPPDPPAQPDVSVAGPTSILAQWSPPGNDGGSPITGYRVLVNGPDGPQALPSNGTQPSLEIPSLTAGQPYSVQVIAVNEQGLESLPSNVSIEVRPDQAPGPPGRPTVVFHPESFTNVQVSWDASFNEGSPLEEHEIELGECGRPGTTVGGNQISAEIPLGDSAVSCTFRVRARNATVDAAGSPVWSPWSEFSQSECSVGLPATPNSPSALRGNQLAEVAWQQPDSNDCQPLLRYEIQRFVGGEADGPPRTVAQNLLNESSAPLTNGATYTFRVRAENRRGWSDWSAPSAPVIPCGAPLPPTSVTAERGNMQAGLTFSGESDNGCPITSFDVEVNGSVRPITQGSPVTGLENGTAYTFRVRGVNEEGVGEWSASSNTVTPAGPPIVLQVGLGNGEILDWSAVVDANGLDLDDLSFAASGAVANSSGSRVVDDGGQGIQDFDCINREGNRCNNTVAVPTLQCVQSAQAVTFSVTVSSQFGSDSASATSPLNGCPSAPSLNGSAGSGEVSLSWTIPSGTTAIYLEVGNNGQGVSAGNEIGGSSVTFGAADGRPETYRIWACNQFGCTQSNAETLTPQPPGQLIGRADIQTACGATGDPGDRERFSASVLNNLDGQGGLGIVPSGQIRCTFTIGTGTNIIDQFLLTGQDVCNRSIGGRFEVHSDGARCV